MARSMLQLHRGALSRDEDDTGCIKTMKMKITLTDETPVQQTYRSVPKAMYKEVKDDCTDLLRRGWIQKYSSSYSSPRVCVRKKDGTLRLCIDYRELNRKTVPDRQPIPRADDVLESPGGNKWFSTLDLGKAYHQGFMKEESQPLTAFVYTLGPV
ncbi:hypothetical protein BSL78_15775 [Apostichopus japonicus]|uniref:Reverse transcriptase domain-containing protein n=1 Tax=Stichopus japonicus TaxID=307972 RepID=A0A2G8KHA5_STIJA|nr:hypothetical protein BSL78_15775 [Apostichopus japonicus]